MHDLICYMKEKLSSDVGQAKRYAHTAKNSLPTKFWTKRARYMALHSCLNPEHNRRFQPALLGFSTENRHATEVKSTFSRSCSRFLRAHMYTQDRVYICTFKTSAQGLWSDTLTRLQKRGRKGRHGWGISVHLANLCSLTTTYKCRRAFLGLFRHSTSCGPFWVFVTFLVAWCLSSHIGKRSRYPVPGEKSYLLLIVEWGGLIMALV